MDGDHGGGGRLPPAKSSLCEKAFHSRGVSGVHPKIRQSQDDLIPGQNLPSGPVLQPQLHCANNLLVATVLLVLQRQLQKPTPKLSGVETKITLRLVVPADLEVPLPRTFLTSPVL